MPYITEDRREMLDRSLMTPNSAGELNYTLTSLLTSYLKKAEDLGYSRYTCINEIVGVLECAKLELYRRVAAPYENQKCEENGDVY